MKRARASKAVHRANGMHIDTEPDAIAWCFVALLLVAMMLSVSLLTVSVLAHADLQLEPLEPHL